MPRAANAYNLLLDANISTLPVPITGHCKPDWNISYHYVITFIPYLAICPSEWLNNDYQLLLSMATNCFLAERVYTVYEPIIPNMLYFTICCFSDHHQTSNTRRIRHTKFQKLSVSRLALWLSFAQTIVANCSIENVDVVETAPTGDSPTTYEWSTTYCLLMCHILEVWRYIFEFR